jgi:hypothetical protein
MHNGETGRRLSEVKQKVVTVLAETDGCNRPPKQNVIRTHFALQLRFGLRSVVG